MNKTTRDFGKSCNNIETWNNNIFTTCNVNHETQQTDCELIAEHLKLR